MKENIDEAFYNAAKEYNDLCDECVAAELMSMPERVKIKTMCMESHGLDPLTERKFMTVLSFGIRKGGEDFDTAAEIGYRAYEKLCERYKEEEIHEKH